MIGLSVHMVVCFLCQPHNRKGLRHAALLLLESEAILFVLSMNMIMVVGVHSSSFQGLHRL